MVVQLWARATAPVYFIVQTHTQAGVFIDPFLKSILDIEISLNLLESLPVPALLLTAPLPSRQALPALWEVSGRPAFPRSLLASPLAAMASSTLTIGVLLLLLSSAAGAREGRGRLAVVPESGGQRRCLPSRSTRDLPARPRRSASVGFLYLLRNLVSCFDVLK